MSTDGDRVRDRLFISHANPEDNLPAKWLALRLASEGFGAWCDQTDLLGGERFWSDIESAIRQRTIRFLLLLSRHSNQRTGVIDELEVALAVGKQLGIEGFVVPLWLDDLLPGEFNIRLKSVNAIPFQRWSAGLDELMRLLDREKIPHDISFNLDSVRDWWREEYSGQVLNEGETLISNLFPLKPFAVTFTEFDFDFGATSDQATIPFANIPHQMFGRHLISCLTRELIEKRLPQGVRVKECTACHYNTDDTRRPPWGFRDERQVVARLLNDSWRRFLAARTIPTHEFTGSTAFYFCEGDLNGDRMDVRFPDGTCTWRLATGRRGREVGGKTVGAFHWHFAISARATNTPVWSLCVRPHVLFSDDGLTIWESDDRLQRKRRSFCRRWWNDDFRDRNLGAVQFLAGGTSKFTLLDCDGVSLLEVATQPLIFDCPVTYKEDPSTEDDPELVAEESEDDDSDDIEQDELV